MQGMALLTIQAHYPKPKATLLLHVSSKCSLRATDEQPNSLTLHWALPLGLWKCRNESCIVITCCWPIRWKRSKRSKPNVEILQHTVASCLHWWCCNAVSLTLIVYIQDHKGWDWGFGISSIAIFSGIILFVSGLPLYRIHVVQGGNKWSHWDHTGN